jgi:hypothetical protein
MLARCKRRGIGIGNGLHAESSIVQSPDADAGWMTRQDAVRMLGVLSLGLATLLLVLCLLNVRSSLLYGQPKWSPPLLVGATYCAALGVGMLFLRKWAVILYAASTTAIGLCLVVGSILHGLKTEYPWVLVDVPMGFLFCLYLIAAILCWRDLK